MQWRCFVQAIARKRRRASSAGPEDNRQESLKRCAGLAGDVGRRLCDFARYGLFALCWTCRSVVPRRLQAADYAAPQRVVLESRRACESLFCIPLVEHWPAVLWRLPPCVQCTLRVVRIHGSCVSAPRPQGFRRHAEPCRLHWEVQSVEARIQDPSGSAGSSTCSARISAVQPHLRTRLPAARRKTTAECRWHEPWALYWR